MTCCSTTWIDYLSALGPVVAAFIAIGVAIWQGILQKRQHNLSLLEKRLDFWAEVKKIGSIAQSPNHATMNEIAEDPQKNHWLLLPKIHELQSKAKVLLDENVERKLVKLESIYKNLHEKTDEMFQARKYARELMEDKYKKEYSDLLKEVLELRQQNEEEWVNLAILIFKKIRELKV